MTGARPYAGIDAADRLEGRRARLLEAGLDLLGSDVDPAELTVRGICTKAGVATRYFYESFGDKDEFVSAVFDWTVGELALTTQAEVSAAVAPEQNRAGLANLVRCIHADPRIGRLLFSAKLSNVTVARKRQESEALFVMLSGQHMESTLDRPSNDQIRAFAHFAVGGVGQTISAWLAGHIRHTPDELIDQLAEIIRRSAAVLGGADASASVNSRVQQANSSTIPSGSQK